MRLPSQVNGPPVRARVLRAHLPHEVHFAHDRARPRRLLVEKISAPQAEIKTAGVIIAVRTASAY
jgi:hypothetical protein